VLYYTHISDQYTPFYTKVIAANARDATHQDGRVHEEGALCFAISPPVEAMTTDSIPQAKCKMCLWVLAHLGLHGEYKWAGLVLIFRWEHVYSVGSLARSQILLSLGIALEVAETSKSE
jgi:hypothetical protein